MNEGAEGLRSAGQTQSGCQSLLGQSLNAENRDGCSPTISEKEPLCRAAPSTLNGRTERSRRTIDHRSRRTMLAQTKLELYPGKTCSSVGMSAHRRPRPWGLSLRCALATDVLKDGLSVGVLLSRYSDNCQRSSHKRADCSRIANMHWASIYRSGRSTSWVKVKCPAWREANRNRGALFGDSPSGTVSRNSRSRVS